jgi:hypothetical protein
MKKYVVGGIGTTTTGPEEWEIGQKVTIKCEIMPGVFMPTSITPAMIVTMTFPDGRVMLSIANQYERIYVVTYLPEIDRNALN